MDKNKVPEDFLNLFPVPLLVAKVESDSLNYPVCFVNHAFESEFGWSSKDIPDKNRWWEKAYPDPEYRTAVERQWELALATADEHKQEVVEMTVNITTRFNALERYRVATQTRESLIPGFSVVILQKEQESP